MTKAPAERITGYKYGTTSYTMPDAPPVFLEKTRKNDESALKWLIKDCEVRPTSGTFAPASQPDEVFFE